MHTCTHTHVYMNVYVYKSMVEDIDYLRHLQTTFDFTYLHMHVEVCKYICLCVCIFLKAFIYILSKVCQTATKSKRLFVCVIYHIFYPRRILKLIQETHYQLHGDPMSGFRKSGDTKYKMYMYGRMYVCMNSNKMQ